MRNRNLIDHVGIECCQVQPELIPHVDRACRARVDIRLAHIERADEKFRWRVATGKNVDAHLSLIMEDE